MPIIAAVRIFGGTSAGTEHRTERTIDRSRVPVLLFRVTAADSGLVYLREGTVDLLAASGARLVGEMTS